MRKYLIALVFVILIPCVAYSVNLGLVERNKPIRLESGPLDQIQVRVVALSEILYNMNRKMPEVFSIQEQREKFKQIVEISKFFNEYVKGEIYRGITDIAKKLGSRTPHQGLIQETAMLLDYTEGQINLIKRQVMTSEKTVYDSDTKYEFVTLHEKSFKASKDFIKKLVKLKLITEIKIMKKKRERVD